MANWDLDVPYHPSQDFQPPEPSLIDLRSTPGAMVDTRTPLRSPSDFTSPSPSTPDLTGQVDRPNILQLLPKAILDPQGLRGAYARTMAERARPVAQQLYTTGIKALYEGDDSTVQKVMTGLSGLSGQFPEYGRVADQFMKTVTDRRVKIEGNDAVLAFLSNAIPAENKEAHQAIGVLKSQRDKLNPEQTLKMGQDLYPGVTQHKGYAYLVSKISGKITTQVTPTMLELSDLTPTQNEALESLGIDKQKFVNLNNKAAADEKMTANEWNMLSSANQVLYGQGGAIPQAIGRKAFPPSQAIEKGFSPEEIPSVLGLGKGGRVSPTSQISTREQVQTLKNVPVIAQQLQMPQDLTRLWGTILQKESSMGHPSQLVGDGGTAFGPGQIRQPALDEVNKAFNSQWTLEDLKQDPNLAQYVSAQFLTLLNQRHKGDLAKIAEAYNGSGPEAKEYAKDVMSRMNIPSGVSPRTGQSFTNFDPTRETPAQYYQRLQQFRKGAEATTTTAGTQEAMGATEPRSKDQLFWKWIDGKPQQYQGVRLSDSEMNAQGWLKTSLPEAETKRIYAYSGFREQGEQLFETIKNFPADKLSGGARAIAVLIGRGVRLPIALPKIGLTPITVEVPGIGNVTLDPAEQEILSKLTSFSQASEAWSNVSGKDNAAIEAAKGALTGAFASKDSMLTEIKSQLDNARAQVKGMFKTIPGAIVGEDRELTLPPPSRQGNYSDIITSEINSFATGKYDEQAKAAFKAEVLEPLAKAITLTHSSLQKLVSQWEAAFRKTPLAKKELPDPQELLSSFGQFLKTLIDPNYKPTSSSNKLSTYEAVTPPWARTQKAPVDDKTLKSVGDKLKYKSKDYRSNR